MRRSKGMFVVMDGYLENFSEFQMQAVSQQSYTSINFRLKKAGSPRNNSINNNNANSSFIISKGFEFEGLSKGTTAEIFLLNCFQKI